MEQNHLFSFSLTLLPVIGLLVAGGVILLIVLLCRRRPPAPAPQSAVPPSVPPMERPDRRDVLRRLSQHEVTVQEAERLLAAGEDPELPNPAPPQAPRRNGCGCACGCLAMVALLLLLMFLALFLTRAAARPVSSVQWRIEQ